MNTDSDPENILKKYKLRQPSSDLKARIASATHAEWGRGNEGRAVFVDFSAPMWRLAVSLAASLLIAVAGNFVNNMITAPFAGGDQNSAVTFEPTVNAGVDKDLDVPARIQSVARAYQPVDMADFVKIRETLSRELEDMNGLFEKNDETSLPGQWMYNLKSVSTERGRV
ncbi:MAG: hypothetical protein A2283_08570 [Lentisphaerae bacterium RIFOXYA12_FULL_48_11]|nr:MAG: hypothetical protein A2283_08570 [Lentisphaerae bacterium RIFOXYA12_FULL_48_11]